VIFNIGLLPVFFPTLQAPIEPSYQFQSTLLILEMFIKKIKNLSIIQKFPIEFLNFLIGSECL